MHLVEPRLYLGGVAVYREPFKKLKEPYKGVRWSKMFRDVKRTIETIDKLADDDTCYAFGEYRRWNRAYLIDLFAPDRHCPKCGKLCLKNRSWVLLPKYKAREFNAPPCVICRGCYMKRLFKESERRFELNGRELGRLRRAAGITQKRFAYLCGWSQPYQCKLEKGEYTTLSEESMNVIKAVLTKGSIDKG